MKIWRIIHEGQWILIPKTKQFMFYISFGYYQQHNILESLYFLKKTIHFDIKNDVDKYYHLKAINFLPIFLNTIELKIKSQHIKNLCYIIIEDIIINKI